MITCGGTIFAGLPGAAGSSLASNDKPRRTSLCVPTKARFIEHDLTTVGACVASATPPVDKSAVRKLACTPKQAVWKD